MGIYHLMGLGLSVGAVTTSLSYLAARYERDAEPDRRFFALSGEFDQPPEMKRGNIQALILFTTEEVRDQRVVSLDYQLNQRGQNRGKRCPGEVVPRLLQRLLRQDLRILTEASRDPTKPMRRDHVEVYWCLYEPNHPTQAFERTVAVLSATKAVGGLGKETWVNLTGGTNIVNSALQLAVSLLGVSARLYYTWTENPACAFHTVNKSDLGQPERDRFWVELPIVYFGFNEQHRCILDLLDRQQRPLALKDLYSLVHGSVEGARFPPPSLESRQERLAWFRHIYLLPLRTQGLITLDDEAIALGLGWDRLQRYYKAISWPDQPRLSLRELAEKETWLSREKWTVD